MAISEKGIEFLENSITRGRPVPGQSLTNSKEQPYNWERPPDFTEPREAMYAIFNGLIEPETAANTLLSISKGVGVIDIASIMLYTGFIEGNWNPDLMLILMEPTMYMIMALAEKAEIEYVLETGEEDEPIIRDPDESIRFINEKTLSLDKLRKESALKINSQSIPKEIKEQVEKIELAPSLLEKLEIEKQNDSLLSRGEQ